MVALAVQQQANHEAASRIALHAPGAHRDEACIAK
jgi:hypothetical protein